MKRQVRSWLGEEATVREIRGKNSKGALRQFRLCAQQSAVLGGPLFCCGGEVGDLYCSVHYQGWVPQEILNGDESC